MPLQSRVVFPVEVLQLIVDELPRSSEYYSRDDWMPSMMSCCLVSKDFIPLCRRHIFQNVTFGPYGSLDLSRKRLAHLLTSRPYLSSYIEEAQLNFDRKPHTKEQLSEHLLSRHDDQHSVTLYELLPRVNHLKIYHTSCYENDEGADDWSLTYGCQADMCHQIFINAINEFCKSDVLTTLTLGGLDVFMKPVFDLPNLEDLTILHSTCKGWAWKNGGSESNSAVLGADVRPRRLPLKRLNIECVHDFAIEILGWCDKLEYIHFEAVILFDPVERVLPAFMDPSLQVSTFPTLHEIDISETFQFSRICHNAELAGVKAFPVLRELSFSVEHDATASDEINPILLHVQVLESLQLFCDKSFENLDLLRCFSGCSGTLKNVGIHLYGGTENFDQLIKRINDALSVIQGHNILETITIHMSDMEDSILEVISELGTEFSRFDALLLGDRATNFPSLRKVTLYIPSSTMANLNLLAKAMPRLSESTEIRFTFAMGFGQ